MLRLLKRQRNESDEAAAPPSPTAAAPAAASGQTPSVSSATKSAPATPAAAAAQNHSPVVRRDSDEFFTSAIQELGGDDFLLSPQKVTVADINSIAEATPPSSGRQWTRSLHSAVGSTSPPEAHQHHHQRTRSGSSGGGGSVTRSLFTASEDDQSWLVAAPSGNGRASPGDFMLEDSPPRRASGRGAASAFAPSPSRIPSGPALSPSVSGSSGRSRIPKPASDFASPVKAGGVSGAGGSRIPGSPTPSSASSATRIPGMAAASAAPFEANQPARATLADAVPQQRQVDQVSASASRLPRGPAATSHEVQELPAAIEPIRLHEDYSDVLQPAAQAMEPDAEPAPASPKADVPYGEPYLPQSMLQSQPHSRPPPVAQHAAPQLQVQTEQPGVAPYHAAADGSEAQVMPVGNQHPPKADDLAPATEHKRQKQDKPKQKAAAQKSTGCCGCCIM